MVVSRVLSWEPGLAPLVLSCNGADFNFAVVGEFPYEPAGPDAVLLWAGRAPSARPVSVKPGLSRPSAAITSAGGVGIANDRRAGGRLNPNSFCHVIAPVWMCIKVS